MKSALRVLGRHGSVRLRLALLSSGLFLLLGTALIVLLFVLGKPQVTLTVARAVPRRFTIAPYGGGPAATLISPGNLITAQHNADNSRLFAASWVVLLLTALASVPLGWFASGRMLRPLREITARTKTITAGNLHERLALTGAPDEFTELGETLDDLLARLESSFDAQRRFVANASHELRTPLTLERTLLQVALADPNATAETLRATCEELLASGRDHERLLEALLTLASSERGLESRERFDLGELATAVLARPRAEIAASELTLISEIASAPADGDPALITRLIANLVDNAVRHNIHGGRVEIGTAVGDDRHATVTIRNTGDFIGLDEVETMFEPFRRLGPARTGSDRGQHGLGLSIVRAIANAHGATLEVRPRPEGGLAVTVSFPPPPEPPA